MVVVDTSHSPGARSCDPGVHFTGRCIVGCAIAREIGDVADDIVTEVMGRTFIVDNLVLGRVGSD